VVDLRWAAVARKSSDPKQIICSTKENSMGTFNLDQLGSAVAKDAAIRRRQRLQPVGGKGDKIFPPTYPGEGRNDPPRHVFERRRVKDGELWCVLVDSVQSQANRLEESLMQRIREDNGINIPHVVVDFAGQNIAGITEITSLDAPHRVYDAILRDSLLDGVPFMKSNVGQSLATAKLEDASALLQTSPTALLFGAWHSTGQGGGLGAKFARCLVSEMVGVEVPVEELANSRTGEVETRSAGRRTSSRIDPLGVLSKVEVFKDGGEWDVSREVIGKNAGKVKPSKINHGNIKPQVSALGVTCDYVEHTVVLSFAGLRRLRFGADARNSAGRTLLAALGLLAIAEQDARGYSLRSRCELVCDAQAPLEIVHPDGSTGEITVSQDDALALYNKAFEAAKAAGFTFPSKPIRLAPQDKLVKIVHESQKFALEGEGGESEEEE
jgi:CRISPR-associated protein Csb1